MKIYDCFMLFDEEMLLDLRLNVMDQYVDKFVISEATYMHSGAPKKLIFDINKFTKFKDKIIYIKVENDPPDLYQIKDEDKNEMDRKRKLNAYKREIFQIQKTQDGILNASPEDIILVSDIDEIPDLRKIDLKNINQKIIFFKQKFLCYKLNLLNPFLPWWGTKACKKKYLKSPQWLRSIKNKKYPFWRIDTFFSNKKYRDIYSENNGGWHFTNIRNAEALEKKLSNFLHHIDFEHSGLSKTDLQTLIHEKRLMYNHDVDSKKSEKEKWGKGIKLQRIETKEMPQYVIDNLDKYKEWLDI